MPDTATIELLLKSANQNHGISLTPLQVRSIAAFLVWLDSAAGNAAKLAESTNNMLAAYMNEFGSELMDTLIADAEIADAEEENAVEAEIVEEFEVEFVEGLVEGDAGPVIRRKEIIDDESEEAEKQRDEAARLVAQDEGFNSEPISEDI